MAVKKMSIGGMRERIKEKCETMETCVNCPLENKKSCHVFPCPDSEIIENYNLMFRNEEKAVTPEEQEDDVIHHPKHYCFGKYEPKDVIRDWGLNFNLGSAVKYIARAGKKDDIIQDLEKAREFLSFEIQALKEG